MNNSAAPTPTDVERAAVDQLRRCLPEGWQVSETTLNRDWLQGADLALDVSKPGVGRATLLLEVSQNLDRRDVLLMATTDPVEGFPFTRVVASRYLSKSVREALTEKGISFIDATGNIRLTVDTPVIYISDRGADRDPWARGRPKGNLKGEPAARVVRTLLDFRRDWRVRDLITVSGASTGTMYRVLDYLMREDLVDNREDFYVVKDWVRLLRTWSEDSSFESTNRVMTFIEPRGIEIFLQKITGEQQALYAVTGSVAANEWVSYAPTKATYVYVPSIQDVSDRWGLRPNTTAPNVILLEPKQKNSAAFANTRRSSAGYRTAATAQVAADLLNGPGREPSEGEFLLEWMQAHESEWRRD